MVGLCDDCDTCSGVGHAASTPNELEPCLTAKANVDGLDLIRSGEEV